MDKLASSLEKLYEILKEELDNNHSQAFEEYIWHTNAEGGSCEILQDIDLRSHTNKVISLSIYKTFCSYQIFLGIYSIRNILESDRKISSFD